MHCLRLHTCCSSGMLRLHPQPPFLQPLCLGSKRAVLTHSQAPLLTFDTLREYQFCHCLAAGLGVTHLASRSLRSPLLACSHFSEHCEMAALTCAGSTHHSLEEELVFCQMLHYHLSLPLEWELRARLFSSPRVQHTAWHMASTLYILLINVEGIMIINIF